MHNSIKKQRASPINLLEEVVSMSAGGIKTLNRIKEDELCFKGHYPGRPILPGVLMFEGVVQAVEYYIERNQLALEVDVVSSVQFLAPVFPKDTLICDCECLIAEDKRSMLVKAVCFNGEKKCAKVKISYRTGEN